MKQVQFEEEPTRFWSLTHVIRWVKGILIILSSKVRTLSMIQ
jgi:hypothetical protein